MKTNCTNAELKESITKNNLLKGVQKSKYNIKKEEIMKGLEIEVLNWSGCLVSKYNNEIVSSLAQLAFYFSLEILKIHKLEHKHLFVCKEIASSLILYHRWIAKLNSRDLIQYMYDTASRECSKFCDEYYQIEEDFIEHFFGFIIIMLTITNKIQI